MIIPEEFSQKQKDLEKIAGKKQKEEKLTKRYKEVRFYELKKLNKILKRIIEKNDSEEIKEIEEKIAYVRVIS